MTTTKARINMRVSAPNLDLIREAAEASGQDMTSFVLGAALERARRVLIETRLTRLNPAEAARLDAALEADAFELPALQRLLASTIDREYTPRGASDAITA